VTDNAGGRSLVKFGNQLGQHTDLTALADLPGRGRPSDSRGITRDPSTGALWLLDRGRTGFWRIDPNGSSTAFYNQGSNGDMQSITFDPTTNRLFILDANRRIYEYTTSGGLVRSTRLDATLTTPTGLVRDPATGEFFVTDNAG